MAKPVFSTVARVLLTFRPSIAFRLLYFLSSLLSFRLASSPSMAFRLLHCLSSLMSFQLASSPSMTFRLLYCLSSLPSFRLASSPSMAFRLLLLRCHLDVETCWSDGLCYFYLPSLRILKTNVALSDRSTLVYIYIYVHPTRWIDYLE